MKLYEKNKKSIEYRGKRYPVDFSFNAVLQALEFLDDPLLDDADKIDLCSWVFFKRPISNRLKGVLVSLVFHEIEPENKQEPGGKKSMDIDQDRAYIRAGFRQAYNIDLENQFGKLHWIEFIGLLESLPSDTKMSEIANIRLQPIPKRDKYNSAQVDALIRAKRAVALKEKPGTGNFKEGLMQLFGMLKARAKG
ncbi:MAG TPA: bacteriophage Gp15 family protein [Candidatus Mediterraneibacter vanvlietii]|nr:bacteriophage Gp15 family protein [Candidatus Mediterraneibacter vanvlietii]